jgi:hypothetical protein
MLRSFNESSLKLIEITLTAILNTTVETQGSVFNIK